MTKNKTTYHYRAEYINNNVFKTAFSLVEMLMALLVASLLLAALAPVMTRRMADHELKVMSESSNYEKDNIITIFTDAAEPQIFNIPNDTNKITFTMMGGGGAGGDALYGSKTFTTSQAFTVPKDVTKLRVFMVGGGGGGASGGREKTLAYADIPALNNAEGEILTAGSYTFANSITPPDSYKTPALDTKCSTSNISSNWTIVSNNTTIAPNAKFSKFLDDINITLSKVTACGGGGGNGGGGEALGGSGGYINNTSLNNTTVASNISLGIGAGGANASNNYCGSGTLNVTKYSSGGAGGVGFTGLNGQAGGQGWSKWTTGCCTDSGGGGGGGGATGGSISGNIIFQISGGGGGGGFVHGNRSNTGAFGQGGTGGRGGGSSAGLGGGGAYMSGTTRRVGSGASGYAAGVAGGNSSEFNSYGGGGGGGIGGIGGGRGSLNSIFGANNCNGGKPGAIHLWYSAAKVSNGLKCEYYIPSNGGGGGGAGQITVNEIAVTPNETLYFEIGKGGAVQNTAGANGNTGGATHIRRGNTVSSPSIISAAGGYSGEYSSSSAAASTGGGYRNPNIGTNWTGVDYRINNSQAQGGDGYLASDSANIGYGGGGGSSQNIKGEVLQGGYGGNSIKNGGTPNAVYYGAGGGGGSGSQTNGDSTYGTGAAGASGMIYIEWGGTNGGGGTAGEFTQKILTNFDGTDRKMTINIGKGGERSNGGDTTITVKSGGKNVTLTAKGGIKGKTGNVNPGDHGDETKYPESYSEIYKEFVQSNMNIVLGQKGANDYGGMGGYLACVYNSKDENGNTACTQSIKANDGVEITAGPVRPGCGGSSITAPLYESICIPYSTSANPAGGNGIFGGGGGGGAVLDKTGGKGGKGGDGFVILEYKSVL